MGIFGIAKKGFGRAVKAYKQKKGPNRLYRDSGPKDFKTP